MKDYHQELLAVKKVFNQNFSFNALKGEIKKVLSQLLTTCEFSWNFQLIHSQLLIYFHEVWIPNLHEFFNQSECFFHFFRNNSRILSSQTLRCSYYSKTKVWFIKFEPYINCVCDFMMTFLANPHFILQISHAKTFRIKCNSCP